MENWKWGIVRRQVGKITEFECPMEGTTFGGAGGIRVKLPPGVSAMAHFGKVRDLPKAAMPRAGDEPLS